MILENPALETACSIRFSGCRERPANKGKGALSQATNGFYKVVVAEVKVHPHCDAEHERGVEARDSERGQELSSDDTRKIRLSCIQRQKQQAFASARAGRIV